MSRIATIQSEVCAHYGITREEMLGPRRFRKYTRPRFVAMAIVQDLIPDQSYPMIGCHFRRDHTTVINAVRNVNERRKDAEFDLEYQKMRSAIQARITPMFRHRDKEQFRTVRKGAAQ